MRLIPLTLLLLLATLPTPLAYAAKPHILVSPGKNHTLRIDGTLLTPSPSYIQLNGIGGWQNTASTTFGVGEGDFHFTTKLRLRNQTESAAGVKLGPNFIGFEGKRKREFFLNGPIFGGFKSLGNSSNFFKSESWINLTVTRAANRLTIRINNQTIHTQSNVKGNLGQITFVPWRAHMQIQSAQYTGPTVKIPTPLSRGYTIPTIDLANQKHRQIIVDREPGQYLGHPTTLLLEDNKTILCVYPKGHGRGSIVYKRSTDAGLTWSKRLPTPSSWSTSLEVPTLHRVIAPNGKKRVIMWSGLYPARLAVTEDDGKTWSQLKKVGDWGGIVVMGAVTDLKTGKGHYMAFFHDDGRFIGKKNPNHGKRKFFVYTTRSTDGGLTWSYPRVIATHPTAHLCEPGIIRSPDGKQLAVLLRENSRRLNSFVIFSKDEGKTWTKPKQLPGALTGDRHTGKYTPDGRLFISFRDTTHASPTKGDWVAWVGKYDDIAKGKQGQYRVRLMDNTKGRDCAYPGVEVLPDGTIVTTTYGHWTKGHAPYIVSIRLKLSELDKLAKKQPKSKGN